MCACSEAFHTLRPCAIVIVGVAGSMPVHGIGTAHFLVKQGDKEHIVRIHNCLLCHGEDRFNLISVSQVLRTRKIAVTFSADESCLEINDERENEMQKIFGLTENEGLYELKVLPLYVDDDRIGMLPSVDLTLDDDPRLWKTNEDTRGRSDMKAPTKLGVWHCKVLWLSVKIGMGLPDYKKDYESHLEDFCSSYIVPPSQSNAKRTYRSGEKEDMAQLSLRFMGIGTDRLIQTLKRSRGLTPASKKKGENSSTVPPHNFPQGRWKT